MLQPAIISNFRALESFQKVLCGLYAHKHYHSAESMMARTLQEGSKESPQGKDTNAEGTSKQKGCSFYCVDLTHDCALRRALFKTTQVRLL